MATTASEILTDARKVWKQGHTLTAQLNALAPPFRSAAATRAALDAWEMAAALSGQLAEAARQIAGLFASRNRDEYGVLPVDQLAASADEETALQAAVQALRTQSRDLDQAAGAFNTRFGGYPELLQAAYTVPGDVLGQAAQAELFAGRPDVARIYHMVYGK